MIIYVDESGNLGKQGRYFSIVALVVRKNSKKGKRLKNIVKRFTVTHKLDEIKGKDLTLPERQEILHKLSKKKDHWFGYICLDKKALENKELFNNQAILFNYLFQFIFKKIISQLHRSDELGNEIEDIQVIIDERNIKQGNGKYIEDYLRTKVLSEWDIPFSKIFVSYRNSKIIKLLQIADLASGIIHNRHKTGKTHEYDFLNIKYSIRFPHKNFKLID